MGFLVRIRIKASTPEQLVERRKAMEGIHARYPRFFASFEKASRLETRRRAAEIGGFAALGIDPSDVRVVRLPDFARQAAKRYGHKVARALHYMHTGFILSRQGGTESFVFSNAVDPGQEIPGELFTPLSIATEPTLVRGARDLGDQFRYRYLLVEGGAACAFLIRFGESMTILAVTFEEKELLSQHATTELSDAIGRTP